MSDNHYVVTHGPGGEVSLQPAPRDHVVVGTVHHLDLPPGTTVIARKVDRPAPVDALRHEDGDEQHLCPRRAEVPAFPGLPAYDTWTRRGTLAPTCSFCGSIAQTRFLQLAAQGCEVRPTDKNYKAYVVDPIDGQAKFYFQHLDDVGISTFLSLYNSGTMKVAGGGFYVRPFFVGVAPAARS